MARLTHSDRIKMEALLNAGHSVQEVADQLHVHRATVYREYKRGKYMHRNTEYIEEERYSSDLGQKAHDWYVTGKGRPLKVRNNLQYIQMLEQKILKEKFSPEAALKAFIDVVSAELKKGEKVQLVGFGTFEVAERAAREGRNPQTGETMTIAASKAPKFKAGKALKDLVNE